MIFAYSIPLVDANERRVFFRFKGGEGWESLKTLAKVVQASRGVDDQWRR